MSIWNILGEFRLLSTNFNGDAELIRLYFTATEMKKKEKTIVYEAPDEQTLKAIEFLKNGNKKVENFESLK